MKKKGGWSRVLIAALFLCLSVRGESFGVVRMQDALMETAEMQHAVKEIAKQYAPRRERFSQMKADCIRRMEQFTRPICGPGLGGEEVRRLDKLVKDLNQFQADLERDEALSLQARLDPVRRRMLQVVQVIAETKGLKLVLDAKAVRVANALDVTHDAVAEYNKVHPVY